MAAATMRIGELATRTGVSVHVLRVWERRYGLLTPRRSTGGYRLYGPSDEWRVRETVRLRATGVSTAQAAAAALAASRQSGPHDSARSGEGTATARDAPATAVERGRLRDHLLEAIDQFDGSAAHAVLDVTLEQLGVEEALRGVVLPVLHETGVRWADGTFTVAQEHFASNLVRSRLATLTLAWDGGSGPLAVLACPPGEQHELGLLAFGVVLGRAGWRVRYLGADTPVDTLTSAVQSLRPDLVVLASVQTDPLAAAADELGRLDRSAQRALRAAHFVVGGAGATQEVAEQLGAVLLDGDPVEGARLVNPRGEHSP
ncbi:MerR family transcriptional regulator [Ornithinimicrobium faecis]|uniref:MerR family transcriptional regulator n=1 Tax=Ornithinimicrobium faecis TaxID=2934158 RepID=A0ABY4YZC0_9MICO|nr:MULTISPECIES: MerR family transcriptional regulator [unclassified Ornithinimicrobium]USQ82096.1 MerR family transcriptional regulator [Ornithinimicrobium sp. HY1793]